MFSACNIKSQQEKKYDINHAYIVYVWSNILPTVTFWIFYHVFLCPFASPHLNNQQPRVERRAKASQTTTEMRHWRKLNFLRWWTNERLMPLAPFTHTPLACYHTHHKKLTTWTCGIIWFYVILFNPGGWIKRRERKMNECIKKIKIIKKAKKKIFL